VRRSLTLQVLLALFAGLGLGTAVSLSGDARLTRAAEGLEPVGMLWVNAILMTVLPLVISGLVVAIVSASRTGLVGSLGRRSVGLFLLLLVLTTLAAALVVPPLMRALPLGGDTAASFRETLASAAATAPPRP
jgi:proton glutamate symport protein